MNIKEEIQSKAFEAVKLMANPKSRYTLGDEVVLLSDLYNEDGSGIIDRLEKENESLKELLMSVDEVLRHCEDFTHGEIGDQITTIRHQIKELNLLNQTKKD